jgi:pyruvate/2-oxoglutarate dehydrogenase complex dihydrolipoamide acyltransferase (E2) component
MSNEIAVNVPDIGDFSDVPVIEVLVKVGDSVKAEDALVTLESDKATMDVPSPADGKVKALQVKIGDKVSQGTPILRLEGAGASSRRPRRQAVRAGRPKCASRTSATSRTCR